VTSGVLIVCVGVSGCGSQKGRSRTAANGSSVTVARASYVDESEPLQPIALTHDWLPGDPCVVSVPEVVDLVEGVQELSAVGPVDFGDGQSWYCTSRGTSDDRSAPELFNLTIWYRATSLQEPFRTPPDPKLVAELDKLGQKTHQKLKGFVNPAKSICSTVSAQCAVDFWFGETDVRLSVASSDRTRAERLALQVQNRMFGAQ
jgi:hypothetical protein